MVSSWCCASGDDPAATDACSEVLETGLAATSEAAGDLVPRTDDNWLSEIPQALTISFVLSSLDCQANAAPTVTMMMKP
jgi:ABC-type proline/glycine betaine transport system substrate-binding protein